jgi:hypothetical protein
MRMAAGAVAVASAPGLEADVEQRRVAAAEEREEQMMMKRVVRQREVVELVRPGEEGARERLLRTVS